MTLTHFVRVRILIPQPEKHHNFDTISIKIMVLFLCAKLFVLCGFRILTVTICLFSRFRIRLSGNIYFMNT